MKRLLIIICMLASLSSGAQKTNQPKPDTANPQITADTPLLSVKDYEDFLKEVVQELPAKYADPIRDWFIKRLQAKAQKFIPSTQK